MNSEKTTTYYMAKWWQQEATDKQPRQELKVEQSFYPKREFDHHVEERSHHN